MTIVFFSDECYDIHSLFLQHEIVKKEHEGVVKIWLRVIILKRDM